MRQILLGIGALLLMSSCVSVERPIKEYTLARAAQQAATSADASKFAPKLFHRSQKLYKKGERLFKERYYDKAKKSFLLSKRYAEKAEAKARVKQFQSGDLDGF